MSIVVGYPVTDRKLDTAYEWECAEDWEEQNKHSAEWDKALEAVGYLNPAIEQMGKTTDLLVKAKDQVSDTSAEYRLGSLIDEFEDLVCEFEKLRKQFTEGVI